MIRQFGATSTVSSTPTTVPSVGHQDLNTNSMATKVAEVFLTAGHAFQKLGDLTLQLQNTTPGETDEAKWSANDLDQLKDALTRFAHELNNISESVQSRTAKLMKTDMKRRAMGADDLRCGSPASGVPLSKRPTTAGQILVGQNTAAKRTTMVIPTNTGNQNVSTAGQSISGVATQYGTSQQGTILATAIPRGMTCLPRPRPAATTTPAVGATITLQSSQPILQARSSSTLLPEPAHYLETSTSDLFSPQDIGPSGF